ncbi:MAG: hypothetical protein VB071_02080, partial [Lawsonibacter sp.]|nr:hypothetical protein [Lawsonibacter sp.]
RSKKLNAPYRTDKCGQAYQQAARIRQTLCVLRGLSCGFSRGESVSICAESEGEAEAAFPLAEIIHSGFLWNE